MPHFHVITEELTAASAKVGSSGAAISTAHAGMQGIGGALANTPAAFAYDGLIASVNSASASLTRVAGELSRALAQAAVAYQISDQSAADTLTGG